MEEPSGGRAVGGERICALPVFAGCEFRLHHLPDVGASRPAPAIVVHEVSKGQAVPPARSLQQRLRREIDWIPEAQVGYRNNMLRDAQNLTQLRAFQDADPTHSDAFSASRQPQILYGAACGINVRFRRRVSPQHFAGPCRVAGDANVHRRLHDSFQLQRQVLRTTWFVEELRGSPTLAFKKVFYLQADIGIGHEHEVPRLHEPDRRPVVCGAYDACQNVRRNFFVLEGANVTARINGVINASPLFGRKVVECRHCVSPTPASAAHYHISNRNGLTLRLWGVLKYQATRCTVALAFRSGGT